MIIHPARVPYEDARNIHFDERDTNLDLDSQQWPYSEAVRPKCGWQTGDGYLYRVIFEHERQLLAEPILETLLRFPSASLNDLQRLHEDPDAPSEHKNFHTYRVFSHPKADFTALPVRRIFLMHNGLNELDGMGFYYQLASHLINNKPDTVCILRPFPGHLTRSPFQAFAETPLHRYLWDGSHLFRQFLRYIIETQWFLSVIVRRSQYLCPSGADLLAENADQSKSRLEHHILAEKMKKAWDLLDKGSTDALNKVRKQTQCAPPTPNQQLFCDAIRSLRDLLHLTAALGPKITEDDKGKEPALHVIGYSLGGFTAQSVFMSWPFLVASCSTLMSGGALRELAPTAFADPEEWQTVLHSLRYELDDAMMSGRYGHDDNNVTGINRHLFRYFTRIFYEVFQQEYHGSFQTRLAAFRNRMLFVVGGNDPIVRPDSVLASAPPGGINMFEVGGLGHFLGSELRDPEEIRQRSFWLPVWGNLIDRLADRAADEQSAERKATSLDSTTQLPQKDPEEIRRLTVRERLAVERDGSLRGQLFERCLDDLLTRLKSTNDSVLFILRNEVPTLLLGGRAVLDRGAVLNHDDVGIVRYTNGVLRRQEVLLALGGRTSVILPWNVEQIMRNIDAHPGYPSQAESVGGHGQMPARVELDEAWLDKVWEDCVSNFKRMTARHPDAVRLFDWRTYSDWTATDPDSRILREAASNESHGEPLRGVPSIPDCWVWMSTKFLGFKEGERPSIEEIRKRLPNAAGKYASQTTEPLDDELRSADLRIVAVSRARYNPRFRGRIVVNATAAKKLLIHVALCVKASRPLSELDSTYM